MRDDEFAFGAIDAGSNGIRLAIGRADADERLVVLKRIRCAVRLGHFAFTRHRWTAETIDEAAKGFKLFRKAFDAYGVTRCRAVATSAAREAENRDELFQRVARESGIDIELIDGDEEARLVRRAVLNRLAEANPPELIVDIGGGSLELNLLRDGQLLACQTLPLGTVRLLEDQNIDGAISAGQTLLLVRRVTSLLERSLGPQERAPALAAACGGNAEALARLAPGPDYQGMNVLSLDLLNQRLDEILRLDVKGRMRVFDVRQDRAEVMGVAAIVLCALGAWMGFDYLIAPGVGVREGILLDLAASHHGIAARGAVA